MDPNTVKNYHRPPNSEAVRSRQAGDIWLDGGTWLFTEALADLDQLSGPEVINWPPLSASPDGLEISATCPISDLNDFIAPHDWIAAPLLKECCRSLITSAALWNEAGGGGSTHTTLPAGALISLTAALDGSCTLWPRHGSPREIPIVDLINGNQQNTLAPGELLRSIWLPASALRKHYTLRRFSLTANGRASVLLVGTLCPSTGTVTLTITAAARKPVQLVFPDFPSAMAIHLAINENVAFEHSLADPHDSTMHRRHLTYHYAEKILQELAMI